MDAPNPDYADAVRTTVLAMPAAQLLGFTFGELAPGVAEIHQPYRVELTQGGGIVQGGVLGSLADFAAGSAAGTLLPTGWVNMTLDFTVKLLAPAKGDLVARGRVLRSSSTLTTVAADVYAGDTLCATALVSMRNVKLG